MTRRRRSPRVPGNNATYTATITPEASGTVTVDITAGAAQDSAGNPSAAAEQFSIVAVAPHVDQRETFYMLRVSRGLAPGALREDEHARIWAWSDLHLGHTETLRAFGRPFASADEMDDKIFWSWRRVIAPEDTVLILGDLTVHGLVPKASDGPRPA